MIVNEQYKYSELTGNIIKCCMTVHSKLRAGFPELYYERALIIEFDDCKIQFQNQVDIPVYYKGKNIGKRIADFVIEQKIILEIKAISNLEDVHLAQALNYLEITNHEVGLLINFGSPSLQFKRLINTKQ